MKTSPLLSLFAPSLLWLTASSVQADKFIDFEGDDLDASPPGWVFNGDSSNVLVAATAASGDYPGGQAIRTDESGASYAAFPYSGVPTTSIQADFLWDFSEVNTPTLAVYAWDDDDGDGFQAAERTIGFGLDNDGQFELSGEAGEIVGTTDFVANTWYRLTMAWSDADASGGRTVNLTAFDLTNRVNLGVVATSEMSAEEFGVAPSEWDGIAFRMTRGTIDNIAVTSPPGAFAFVDATPLNTTLNSDPENSPNGVPLVAGTNYIDDGTSGSGTDGFWTYRSDAAFATFEGGTAFETDNGTSLEDVETTEDLITTVNIPVAGTYDLVAVFTRNNNRDIAARLGESPDLGDISTVANALNTDQTVSPLEIEFGSSFTNSRLANSGASYLGTVTTTTANEEVRIFVNGFASTPADDSERTQYEGIGYRSTTAGLNSGPEITGFNYALDAELNPTVTLTWRKTEAPLYIVKFSLDLTGWDTDLEDNITVESDENPEDFRHITMTFPLSGIPENASAVFFRIEEG
jgi:hypothetical protein